MSNINERIKQLRKFTGMSQTEFGKDLGVKIGVIKNLEYGITTPSEEQINLMALRFYANPEWIKNGTGKMLRLSTPQERVSAFLNDAVNDKNKTHVLWLLSHLDDEDWNNFSRLLKVFTLLQNDLEFNGKYDLSSFEKYFKKLNAEGRSEALKRVQELTMIVKYTTPDAEREE